MPDAFEKLISTISPDARVLEVGTAGHEGENTSLAIAARFKKENIQGFNIKPVKWDKYQVLEGDFYTSELSPDSPRYDLVVLDLNIDRNLDRDWTDAGLEHMRGLLAPGGRLINYVMMTTEYGDYPVTPALIKAHMHSWWGEYPLTNRRVGEKLRSLPGWELELAIQEERRPYILWCLLKKIE